MIVLILAVCFNLVSGKGLDLPSYIPKCSLSDPNLNECIRDSANKAIPVIAKGDESFGIPSVSPILLVEGLMVCRDLTILAKDVTNDDMKNLKIIKALLDLKSNKLELSATLDRIEVTAKNYTIISGKFIDVTAEGHGRINMTFVKTIINYNADIRTYKKDGETYFELVKSVMASTAERGHYYFENLKSSEKDDMASYIDENWQKFREQITPAIETYLRTFIHFPFNAIFTKVPMNKLFLP